MKEESPLYIGIENPEQVRRSLLEASKSVIRALQLYEGLSSLREKKFSEMEKYKELTNEIGRLIKQLKAELPKYNLRQLPKAAGRIMEHEEEKAERKPLEMPQPRREKQMNMQPKRKLSEVERLERELSSIEEKLSAL